MIDWAKIFNPYANNNTAPAVPEEPEPMEKNVAEEMLGMDFDYTKEQLDQKYREAVQAGMNANAPAEELEAIDAAKSALDGCFVEGVESVVVSDAKPAPKPEIDDFEFIESTSKTTGWAAEHTEAPSMVFLYDEAHYDACKALNVPCSCNYPAPKRSPKPPIWYRIVFGLVHAPVWRILFIAVLVIFGVATIDTSMNDPMSDAIAIIFQWGGLVILMGINTIFGTFTNLIRVGVAELSFKILKTQLFMQERTALKNALRNHTASNGYVNSTSLGIREK